jgi:hypothetical protein
LESGVAITPDPLIGFPLEDMRWKAMLKGFPYIEVPSTLRVRETPSLTGWQPVNVLVSLIGVLSMLTGLGKHPH